MPVLLLLLLLTLATYETQIGRGKGATAIVDTFPRNKVNLVDDNDARLFKVKVRCRN